VHADSAQDGWLVHTDPSATVDAASTPLQKKLA
jgi:hypothetical protein